MIIRKDALSLSLPIITEQAFIMAMGVINTIMAGRLGQEVVSAVGMIDSINNIFIALFQALAVGGTVVVAQYTGQRNLKAVNEAANHSLISGTAISIIVTILIYIFKISIVRFLFGNAEQQVMENSFIYLDITLLTYPFIALTSIAFGVLRGIGDTKTPMIITIIMNIANVILSFTLIYGLNIGNTFFQIAIPSLGIRGAALGIAIARIIGTLLVVYNILRVSNLVKLRFEKKFKINTNILGSIFGIGIPAGIESMLFHGGKLITQVFIVGMGTASIAANYIAGSVFGLVNIPGIALSIAATTMVGQYMGRGEPEEANKIIIYLTKFASLCLAVLGVLLFPLSGFIASIYTTSREVIEIASPIIKTAALTMPTLWTIAFIFPAGLKGAGDAKYTLVVSMVGMWIFRIILGYILAVPFKLGVMGIWMGMYVDWIVRLILFYLRVRHGKWKQNVVIDKN